MAKVPIVATFERQGYPRATVTYDGTRFSCVIDHIDGLSPTRSVSAEEGANGIDSLDPPTVHAAGLRELIDLAACATSSALESTLGGELSPPDILLCNYYAATATKGALELLGFSV